MRKQLRRLRLKEGDLILMRDQQTCEALVQAAKGLRNIPNCPIVIAPEGVHRLNRDYLRRVLAKADPI
jgi:hypothetical protein